MMLANKYTIDHKTTATFNLKGYSLIIWILLFCSMLGESQRSLYFFWKWCLGKLWLQLKQLQSRLDGAWSNLLHCPCSGLYSFQETKQKPSSLLNNNFQSKITPFYKLNKIVSQIVMIMILINLNLVAQKRFSLKRIISIAKRINY